MNWLRKFMYGRYGMDQLTLAILALAIVVSAVNIFLRIGIVQLLVFGLILLGFLRAFSRNGAARSRENQKFLHIFSRFRGWSRRKKDMHQNRKTHKFFKCPGCKNTLRVPRGKGKVYITCPKCGERFTGRS